MRRDYNIGDKVVVELYFAGIFRKINTTILYQDPIDLEYAVEYQDVGNQNVISPEKAKKWKAYHAEGKQYIWAVGDKEHELDPKTSCARILRKVGEERAPVTQLHLKEPGGVNCAVCKNMVQYSAPNMSDGSFVCRGCRATKGYLIPAGVKFVGN